MAKVAVVIPLYNHEAYIEAAIQSVRNQSRPVDRIIVVDDGSRDAGVNRVRQIADARIELHVQENAGAHVALNRGIQLAGADCEFTAILNSDDIYLPRRIECCLAAFETQPELGAVCSRVELIDPRGAVLPPDHSKVRWLEKVWAARSEDLPAWLGFANFTKTTSNLVARTEYLLAHPFQPYRYVHDYYFAVVCALEGRLGVLPEPLLQYRTHPANTIKESQAAVAREVIRMNADLLRSLSAELQQNAELRSALTRYMRVLIGNHADFRAEVFLALIASVLSEKNEGVLWEEIASFTPELFPELTAKPLRSSQTQRPAPESPSEGGRELQESTWTKLGQRLGFVPKP